MQWLRLYDDVLDDPKVQRLSAKMFRHWVKLLCLANKGSVRGRIPKDMNAISFRLRVRKTDAEKTVAALISLQLLVETDTAYIPHNWDVRQKKSDSSAERVANLRAKREQEEEACNVTEPLLKRNGNALDTDIEQNRTEQIQRRADAPAAPKAKRATALPNDFPTGDERAWADGEGFTEAQVNRQIPLFVDHYRGHGTAMKDWPATFRNWMRRSRDDPRFAVKSNGHADDAHAFAAWDVVLRALEHKREHGSMPAERPDDDALHKAVAALGGWGALSGNQYERRDFLQAYREFHKGST